MDFDPDEILHTQALKECEEKSNDEQAKSNDYLSQINQLAIERAGEIRQFLLLKTRAILGQ